MTVPVHPAPWKWVPNDWPKRDPDPPPGYELHDAKGQIIANAGGDDFVWINCESAHARALIALAPEMEEAMRDFGHAGHELSPEFGRALGVIDQLLRRIDAAKAEP